MCLAHSEIRSSTSGQVTLTGDLLRLYDVLERAFVALGAEWQPDDFRFPSFIAAHDLKRIDYLHSFPHHATFPAVLDTSEVNIRDFRDGAGINDENEIELTHLAPVQNILTPAACYHFYIHFQGRDLKSPLYLTTNGRCFRREDHYLALERQWNFSMREIVCIGTMEEVDEFVSVMRRRVTALWDTLSLPLEWEIATDPFFDPSNNPKHLLQKLQPNKTEMVFDKRLAVGSVNLHRNYFGEAFEITRDGSTAHSACVAFGLERWIASILDHFGEDPEHWPWDLIEVRQS